MKAQKTNKVVYQHIRSDSNKIFYIGIGNPKRPYSKQNRTTHWYRIVNKYGYRVEIIHTDLDWQSACLIEIDLIKKYGRLDLGTGILINNTNGGDGTSNRIITNEFREKMKNSKLGKPNGRLGIKTANYIDCICINCQKQFQIREAELKYNAGRFCSRICVDVYKKGKKNLVV